MRDFWGEFETHVTVDADDPVTATSLQVCCQSLGLKFHHIILDRGLTPSQPMVTRRSNGRFSEILTEAESLATQLKTAGFVVSRIKVEAAPVGEEIPIEDADAAREPDRYFEHHIKLLLEPHAGVEALTALALGHAARLSRNARRVRTDGRTERFVTQRCYRVGLRSACNRLGAVLAALAGVGNTVLSVEQEYVVHDSRPSVDAGWLDTEGGS